MKDIYSLQDLTQYEYNIELRDQQKTVTGT